MTPLRIVFMGTAELACPSIAALSGHPAYQVVALVTQPDRPKGRDLKLQPPPTKIEANRLGIPVLQPERARNPEFVAQLAALAPELIVVAAYGQILPPSILELPRFGCLNIHTSLLPKYRGAAPIQWAILNGDAETGVTIMRMDAGLDTGPIVSQEKTSIRQLDTAETLHDRLAQLGAALLLKTIPDYVTGKMTERPQPSEGATYARKISKEDGQLDWTQPAGSLFNRVRAFTPWPGAFTFLGPKHKLLKIHAAELIENRSGSPGEILPADGKELIVGCGEHALRLVRVQLEGSRAMSDRDFLAGHALVPGQKLG